MDSDIVINDDLSIITNGKPFVADEDCKHTIEFRQPCKEVDILKHAEAETKQDQVTTDDISTTEGALNEIRKAVLSGDDETLAAILFTREAWSYDAGMKALSDKLLEELPKLLKRTHTNSIAAIKKQIKEQTKPKAKETAGQKEARLVARKSAYQIAESTATDHTLNLEGHLLPVIQNPPYFSELYDQLYGKPE